MRSASKVAIAVGVAASAVASVTEALQIGPEIRIPVPAPLKPITNAAAQGRSSVEQHAEQELTNFAKNTVEAIDVAGKTVDRQIRTVESGTGIFLKHMGEGDVFGAGSAFGQEYVRGTFDNDRRALRESSGLRFAAQVAVAVYGGPAASAAFTSALTYDATGDVGQSLKAGVVSGVASAASAAVSELPTDTTGDILGRAALAGHISGVATAVMGGKYMDGFATGALVSTAEAVYENETWHVPEGRIAGDAYCKTSIDPGCAVPTTAARKWNPDGTPAQIDIRATDPLRNHIGLARSGPSLANEGSILMRTVNFMPGMNTMAYFHDIWAADFTSPMLQLSIVPATVLTYYALGAPRDRDLLEQSMKHD